MEWREFKPGLEGLRGLAALAVAMSHGRSAFIQQDANPIVGFALNIFQPSSAVVVFFVLSGYVLGGSLARNPDYPTSYSFYLLHWPVFYLCVVVALKLAGDSAPWLGNLTMMVVSIAVALAVPWLSYLFIEAAIHENSLLQGDYRICGKPGGVVVSSAGTSFGFVLPNSQVP